ncbi:TonB-dependent receptor [Emcibacter nanhaiensis]|uniref:TonB-dependent receptor n=2 Tax=Emcibacter nanhaiensis TaxID=1505037 RepID=A0A501PD90_9PROT|nr:TonB-dependent receptor [Emcibacter nanhaiensis]
MNKFMSAMLGWAGIVGVMLAAPPAVAQEAQEEGTMMLEEIVVTAQFREQNLQDTPLAITAVNSDMMEARSQTSIHEVAAQAPNVTLTPQGQQNGSGMIAFIRGVGQTDFNYALEPGVAIYVDDVYIPSLTGSLMDLMDLDRVEVLRGPQGTLSGRNAIGGAIKLFSAKPQGDGSGYLQVTYGSFDRIETRGMFDFAISDDLFARVSAVSKSADGHVKRLDYGQTHPGSGVPVMGQGADPVLGTLGGKSYVGGRIALRWTPSEKLEINIAGDYTRERSEGIESVLLYGNHPGTNADGQPWLPSTIDGSVIPLGCNMVPNGVNSCDTLTGYDGRYVSYGTFLDQTPATSQSPYKPLALDPHSYLDNYGIVANIVYDISDNLQLTSITAWREFQSDWTQDVDNSPLANQQLRQRLDNTQWSQELRLNAALMDDALELTVGGFYFDRDGSLNARVDLNYAGIDFIHGPDPTPATNKAVFGNFIYHVTDDFNVTGGIRYSEDHKEYVFYRRNPDLTVPSAPCAYFLGAPVAGPTGIGNDPNCLLLGLNGDAPPPFDGSSTDWRIALDYRLNDDFMVYGQVATGYRAGGFNPRPFFGSTSPFNQIKQFDPENITAYEIGFKADLLDNTVRLNGAAFYNDYQDIILTLAACPISPCLQPNNVGTAEVKGVEFEVTIRPTEALSIDGSFSYLDFQYTELNATEEALGGLTLDMITPYTPETAFSFGVQYDIEDVFGGSLSARFDGTYQSKVYTEAINVDNVVVPANNPELGLDNLVASNKIDGYFLGNLRFTWRDAEEDWQVALEVRNLFDKYYFTSLYEQYASPQTISGAPGLPRTWALTVKRNF